MSSERTTPRFSPAIMPPPKQGNFEGHNILNNLARRERSDDDETRLAPMRAKLLAAREKRVRPGLDDKILADWNGLMIAALVNAGIAFDEPTWIDLAARAFRFVAEMMTRDDRLGHSWRDERLLFPGLASDFAAMIRAALALHEATGERGFLDWAQASQAAFERHYANPETGGYFLTADDAEGLVVRPAATTDDATPNANALAAQNLVRLAALTGNDAWRERADRLFDGSAAARGAETFRSCGAAQCARPAPARSRNRHYWHTGGAFCRGGVEVTFRRSHCAARGIGAIPACRASGAGQDRRSAGSRSLRLCRRDLLAAGDAAGANRGNSFGDEEIGAGEA